MEEQESDMKSSVLERHAQTIMVGLVTVGIIFVSSSINSQNADIRVLQQQNEHLEAQNTRLERTVDDIRRMLRDDVFVTQKEFQLHAKEIDRRLKRAENHIQQDEQGWRKP